MTEDLEKAFAEASKLPDHDQDALARWILAELALEQAWERAFPRSHRTLEALGAEALREQRAGRTRKLDPGKL